MKKSWFHFVGILPVDSDSHSNSKSILIQSTHLPYTVHSQRSLEDCGSSVEAVHSGNDGLLHLRGPRPGPSLSSPKGAIFLCKDDRWRRRRGRKGKFSRMETMYSCTVAKFPGNAVIFLRASRRLFGPHLPGLRLS